MTFGDKDAESARTHTVEEIKAILDVFQNHGHKKVSFIFLRIHMRTFIVQGRYRPSIYQWHVGAPTWRCIASSPSWTDLTQRYRLGGKNAA